MPALVLVLLSVVYRLPALINAKDTNSDAAIVGLQAMHLLRGEFSWFLFGSSYQTSVDSMAAAAWFSIFGPAPLALMLSTLAGHIALTMLVYAMLARRTSRWTAVLLSLPLVFCSAPVHGNALYPPRQAALTLAFVSFYWLDRVARDRRGLRYALAGGAMATLACFADPYALIFLPLLGLHLLLASIDGRPGLSVTAKRVGAGLAGAAAGMVPLLLLWSSPTSKRGETTLTMAMVERNWPVLRDACLPWVMGTKVYAAVHEMDYMPWAAPGPVALLQKLGALMLVLLLVLSAVTLARFKMVAWESWRLGVVGLSAVPMTLLAFLLSPMVMDQFSARYLVAALLTMPFALLPAATVVKSARFRWALAPYLASAAIGGWVAYAPATHGLMVRTGLADEDERLAAELRARGIHVAVADYWVAYRATFLFREDPIVVPSHVTQDRYAPYRETFLRAHEYAYIVDRWRSEESEAAVASRLAAASARFDRVEVGDKIALIVHEPPH